jgi:foldase protein PrsA
MSMLLVACGGAAAGADSVAATVNGQDLTVEDIAGLVGGGDDVVDNNLFSQALNNRIISLAVFDAASTEFGITATEAEVNEQFEAFKTQVAAGAESYEAALEANQITDLYVRQAAEQQVILDQLRERLNEETPEVGDADIDTELELNGDQYRNACVKHILLETEEQALTVKQRLDDGEDFATVAAETSTDPSAADSGGDLGCSPLGRYVGEFSDGVKAATIGEVTDPVESEFGFHLILVDSIDDDDMVRETIATQLVQASEGEYLQEWVTAALTSAEVTVDPQYGTWETDPQPGLVPPADDTTDSTASAPETTLADE